MKEHLKQYPIINPNKPYPGYIEGTATYNAEENTYYIDYSGYLNNDKGPNLTLDEYRVRVNPDIEIVTWEKIDEFTRQHEQSLISEPALITQERFYEMLEVLPPCRWHNCGGFEVFHISERLTGNLVSWFAHNGANYFEFVDHANAKDAHLAAKLTAALGAL